MKVSAWVVVLAGVLLLAILADADVSLGSSSDVTSIKLNPGAYGMFKVSFFNMGEEPLNVDFEVEYPSDLRVEVDPPELSMDEGIANRPDSSGSWLILDGGKRYVKTHPVDVYVKVPSMISRNKYKIKLIATAKSLVYSDGSGFEQSLIQVRETTFTINVDGRVNLQESKVIRVDASSGDVIKEDAERSFAQDQGTSSSSSGGGSSGSSQPTSSSGSNTQSQTNTQNTGGFGVSKDSSGGTSINLPTGKVALSQGQTEAAIDLGLVTLMISIASLLVRILK